MPFKFALNNVPFTGKTMQMEQGWDPEVKQFFLKILNTISWGLIWILMAATFGLYLGWAYNSGRPVYTQIIYYVVMPLSLFFVVRHIYRLWK
jgi:hypothetical protein